MPWNKDLQTLVRKYKRRGWSVDRTSRTHVRWTAPNGASTISPSTPPSSRGRRNLVADLRRIERHAQAEPEPKIEQDGWITVWPPLERRTRAHG